MVCSDFRITPSIRIDKAYKQFQKELFKALDEAGVHRSWEQLIAIYAVYEYIPRLHRYTSNTGIKAGLNRDKVLTIKVEPWVHSTVVRKATQNITSLWIKQAGDKTKGQARANAKRDSDWVRYVENGGDVDD